MFASVIVIVVTNLKFNLARKNIALNENISLCENKRTRHIHIVHRSMQTFHILMIVEELRKSIKQYNKQSLYIKVASHVNSITINLNINIIKLYRN